MGLKLGAAVLLALVLISMAAGSWQAEAQQRLKVVWISVDSANYYRVFNLSQEGHLPTFRRLFAEGAHAPMTVVYPSATAVSHASLSTGAEPIVTGIVGNSIRLPNTTVTSTVSGFDGRRLMAEPIWVTANRSNLRVLVVSFPQSTPPAWAVDANRVKLFNIYDASAAFTPSTLYTNNRNIPRATYIDIRDAANWTGLERLGNVRRAWEFSFRLGDSVWNVLIADNAGDERPDVVAIVPESKDLRRSLALLREGQWSAPLNTTIRSGNVIHVIAPMFKLIKIDVNDFRLYRGITRPFNAPWYNDERMARDVWNNVVARVGAFTDGDWFALTNDWIDVETYMETVNFTNTFFREFTLYAMRRFDWDLVMTYTPVIDNVYHQFLGMLYKNMPYYKPEEEARYRQLIIRTYKMVDDFVRAVIDAVDLRNTVVIVSSDHGQCPVKKLININAILYNAGLISIRGGSVAINETRAWYTTHGHIYVNLRGREAGGIVRPEEYARVVNEIINALSEVRDPDTGEVVFDNIMTREQMVTLGVGGPRAGDVIISTKCGYTAVGGTPTIRDGRAIVFSPAVPLRTLIADHGTILPTYKDMHATLIFFGAQIRRGSLGLVSSLSVAPTVAELLEIPRPRDSIAAPLPVKLSFVTQTITRTETQRLTETVVRTETRTMTQTATIMQTVTETRAATVTQPTTLVRTETQTETRTATTTVQEIRTDVTLIAALVALIAGVALSLFLRK